MIYNVSFFDSGVPKTGLTPTWEYLLTNKTGVDKSASGPSITEVGGGLYKFEIKFETVPWDLITEDLWGVIDGGSSLSDSDRYVEKLFSLADLALARLAFERDWEANGTERVYDREGITGGIVAVKFTKGINGNRKTFTPSGA